MAGPSWKGAALPQRDAGQSDPQNNKRLPGALVNSDSTDATDWQPLGAVAADIVEKLRVTHIARRCRVEPSLARHLVYLALGEVRA